MNAMLGEIYLENCEIDFAMDRNIDRIIEPGVEGDDLIDIGAKSIEFTVKGTMTLEQLKALEAMTRRGQPIFKSDYGEYKVVVRRIGYKSTSGEYTLLLFEDIN